MKEGTKPGIVKLLEPEICLSCNFGKVINIIQNGVKESTIRCFRKDCDNWQIDTLQRLDSFPEEVQ